MRILIDECLDWRLCRALRGHDCVSVQRRGWAGLTNGLLLQKAEGEFDVFLTGDTNLTFQQNLTTFDITVIVLETQSTRLVDTAKLMPNVLKILSTVRRGEVLRVSGADD
jgi:hypothetical protein